MKRLVLITIFLIIPFSFSQPIISNYSVEPQELWMKDGKVTRVPLISILRGDNETNVVCYSDMILPDGSKLDGLRMIESSPYYHIIDPNLLGQYINISNLEGKYIFYLYCRNSTSSSEVKEGWFFYYNIKTTLSASPNPSYLGGSVDIIFNLEENGVRKTTGVSNFKVYLDGSQISFLPVEPKYIVSKNGYFIELSNIGIGEHRIKVSANYKNINIETDEISIKVEDPIQFELLNSNDLNEVRAGENLTIRVKAFDKNTNNFSLKKDYIELLLESKILDFYITPVGNDFYDIVLKLPDLSPGSHNLKVVFNYNSRRLERTKELLYVLPIKGRIINYNDEPIYTEFTLLKDGKTKVIKTDKNGSYYGLISPGTYDVKIKFSSYAELDLKSVEFLDEDLDDFVVFKYYENFDIFGIRSAGTFFLEISPKFSNGKIFLKYNPNAVPDREKMVVYRCYDWDLTRKNCKKMEEIDFELIEKNSEVSTKAFRSSTYIVGTFRSLEPTFSADKTFYYLNDAVTINGVVRDDMHQPVGDADVNLKIPGTEIDLNTKSSANGIFSIKFLSPMKPGNYTIYLEVKKDSYKSSQKTTQISVLEKKDLSIISPDTIRVEKGKTSSIDVSLVNIGQGELSDIRFNIENLPKEYYSFEDNLISLSPSQEKLINVKFIVSENTTEGTYGGKFVVEGGGIRREKVFGFTILPKSEKILENQTQEDKSLTTGKLILPSIQFPDINYLYYLPIIFGSFIFAFLIKKIKKNQKINKIDEVFTEIREQLVNEEKVEKN